jgi:hypothetical protein
MHLPSWEIMPSNMLPDFGTDQKNHDRIHVRYLQIKTHMLTLYNNSITAFDVPVPSSGLETRVIFRAGLSKLLDDLCRLCMSAKTPVSHVLADVTLKKFTI